MGQTMHCVEKRTALQEREKTAVFRRRRCERDFSYLGFYNCTENIVYRLNVIVLESEFITEKSRIPFVQITQFFIPVANLAFFRRKFI